MASVNQIPERNLDVGHGTQNSLLANAHRILTAATPFCSLLPPLAALANVPLSTREPWGMGMRIAVTSTPNFGTKFGWRWLRPRRVGPLGLLAMTVLNLCHSEASAHTGRGNPSFLRWTGVRAAEVVGPYGEKGKFQQPPGPAAQSGAFVPRWQGMGGDRRRGHQNGIRCDCPGSA